MYHVKLADINIMTYTNVCKLFEVLLISETTVIFAWGWIYTSIRYHFELLLHCFSCIEVIDSLAILRAQTCTIDKIYNMIFYYNKNMPSFVEGFK